jgi:hypothetical protein
VDSCLLPGPLVQTLQALGQVRLPCNKQTKDLWVCQPEWFHRDAGNLRVFQETRVPVLVLKASPPKPEG